MTLELHAGSPGKNIEINQYFAKAISLIESGNNLFITGKAGTGKSTLLAYYREKTKKNLVVLAPTGVAAVNVRGQTIHSFFRFRPDITVEKVKKKYKKIRSVELYKKLQTIVIDEISMVRADLFDCVDAFLRIHGPKKGMPFGGVQMIFIGDLYQLPPVVTSAEREIFTSHYPSPYFFDAHVFRELTLELVELEKIYRQKDETFITILNAIRNRTINDQLLSVINSRVKKDFKFKTKDVYIHLVTINAKADEINADRLLTLPGKPHEYEGEMRGEFDEKSLPAPGVLEIKTGAQVMLTNNDRNGRWVNGTVGVVESVEESEEGDAIMVRLETGETVDVLPYCWDMFRFAYNETSRRIDSETIGSFTQYPIILAWAITIHKSQGKTFEKVIVDFERGTFAHGQAYVALSRCTSLSGLILTQPLKTQHVLLDFRVVKFLTQFQYNRAHKAVSVDTKSELISRAISERKKIEIVYLKASDEKSRRIVAPVEIGEMEYQGKSFLGFTGFDELRGVDRVFRVDRILELAIV